MFMKNASNGTLAYTNGVDVVKFQLKIPEIDIIKCQLINGSWINKNILGGLYSGEDIARLAKELN
jgi:hypothetical protein